MAETTAETPLEVEETFEIEVEEPTEYTTESLVGRFAEAIPAAGLGRRKEAIARVRIVPGTGVWKINGRTLEEYLPNKVHQQIVNEPFKLLELDGRYDVIARINGGGISGQAYALPRCRPCPERGRRRREPPGPEEGRLLTRDPRAVERKKAGLKKARKAPQYSKR
ncbi:30S ribosomal protein S9 [Streptacidiphilus sp. 4-A2]|nr:30S ribosomal protein S9 [Streptacidiphilus sp. 4-A2]